MEKTKFGVSAALLSMVCYFTGYMNFTACILMLILALVWSESVTLKKNACQAAVLSIFFELIGIVLGWLSKVYGTIINAIFGLLNKLIDLYEVKQWFLDYNAFDLLDKFLGFAECVLMIVFVILCLKNKVIKLPVITKLINKHFDTEETSAKEDVVSEPVAEEVVEEKPVKKTTRRTKKTATAETSEETKTE